MRNFFVLALLGVVLITIALVVRSGMLARKNPGEPINSAMRAAMDSPQLSGEDARVVTERFPTAHHTTSGLYTLVRSPGAGPAARAGQRVTVNYEGRLLNGVKFDSSYDRGQPLTFTLGAGEVIKGWDEALAGMKQGERITLIVPYWLAYGTEGRGPIPARATLVFEVELMKID